MSWSERKPSKPKLCCSNDPKPSFLPQVKTFPSLLSAILFALLTSTEIILPPQNFWVISIGRLLEIKSPVPSWPFSLFPHVKTRPSRVRTIIWLAPNRIWLISSFSFKLNWFEISFGIKLFIFVPIPSWPNVLVPHVKSRPSEVNTAEKSLNCTDVIFSFKCKLNFSVIFIGSLLNMILELTPSCPRLFKPHINNLPSDVSAAEWDVPFEISTNFSLL